MWYHSNFWWLDDMQDVRMIMGGGEHREHMFDLQYYYSTFVSPNQVISIEVFINK